MTEPHGVTRRLNHGRGHGYLLDGRKVDGVTTAISEGLPKPGLITWKGNATARYAADHLTTLAELNDPEAVYDLLRTAADRDRNAAGVRGTAVHKFAEKLQRGEDVDVPEEYLGHVESCARFLDDFDVAPTLIEAVVGNRTAQYMGTLDGLTASLRIRMARESWLFDWKTNRGGVYGDVALQLAAYRYAELYLDADGNEQPMPEVERTGVVWIRADGYDLVPVTAGPDEFKAFRYVQQVARFRARSRDLIGATIQPTKDEAA